MRLRDFIDDYVSNRDVSDNYANQLYWFANALEAAVGRELLITDLTRELINGHLKRTKGQLSDETRKSRRRMAITLWQAAADDNLLDPPPIRKIMQIRVREKLHRAWTVDEVRALLQAADRLRGTYAGWLPKREYWRSYIMAAWDTGLRGCDLRLLARENISPDGRIVLIQHKTGRRKYTFIREESMAAINESFPPSRELIWPLWGRLEVWRRAARRLVNSAHLVGSIGQLRHSSGTAVEIQNPGRGHEHLGNTRQVFERHYLDHEKAVVNRVLPDRLI